MNLRQVIPRDAIPSVDDPTFGGEYDGAADDRVVVVDSCDPPRAYPIRYLDFHEIVNDVLDGDADAGTNAGPEAGSDTGAETGTTAGADAGTDTGANSASDTAAHAPGGDPIAVTWCPLCGSAVVYERDHGARTLEFGVSGKLADDDLVMYDRETGSEWKQSSGTCLNGPLAGETLSVRPAATTTWRGFRDAYPDGVVLQPPGGTSEAASADDSPEPIDYDESPYGSYADGEGFGLAAHRGTDAVREWERDDDIGPKDVVLGIEIDGDAVGVPLSRALDNGGVVRLTVGGRDVVVLATEADGIHAFADPGYAFEATEAGVVADGTRWTVATGESADGRRLERVPAKRLFAFAWRDDHGADAFSRPE